MTLSAKSRPRRLRRAKIVATLGPASAEAEVVEALARSGVDVFRLNFSHGGHDDHAAAVERVRDAERRLGRPLAVLADVQGPKLRVGQIRGGHVVLQPGRTLRLDLRPAPGDGERVSLPHPEIIEAAVPGTTLLIDDGRIRLEVSRRAGDHLETRVVVGGRLSDRKGVNVPGVMLPIPALTTKDRQDIEFALGLGVDFIALSFVQRARDIAEARELVGDRAHIVSKIEKPQALGDLEEIVRLSDAVMVARGDLGVELPPEDVPLIQRRIVRTARRLGRPVIVVATQMLESMVSSPTPTRAEASDVATAIFDGADAVMLSAETAAGQYPVEAVAMMDRIVARTEQDEEWRTVTGAERPLPERASPDAIAAAARQVAETIGAKTVAAFTHTGGSAARIARQRPECSILGITPFLATARRLSLVWGVEAVLTETTHSMTETVARAASLSRRLGIAVRGEEIVVVAGVPFGVSGGTNSLRVTRV